MVQGVAIAQTPLAGMSAIVPVFNARAEAEDF